MLRKLFGRFYHACWYIVATVILITAVTVTLVRLALPRINDYRDEIQTWVSDQVGYPIHLERISADWEGWTPYVHLHDIEVLDPATGLSLTRLESASLSLNPLTTLIQQRLSPLRITITGPVLQVVRNADGAISIAQGAAVNTYQQQSSELVTGWLLRQRSISIRNARVQYIDLARNSAPLELTNVSLTFRRFWQHMQINSSAKLPAEYGDSLNFSMETHGDITTPAWSGQIYVRGKDILPGNLYTLFPDQKPQLKISSAPANIEIWSHWLEGKLSKLNGHVDASDLNFSFAGIQHHIQRLDTLFTFIKDKEQDYRLRLAIEELTTDNGLWPKTTIDVYKQQSNDNISRYTSRFDYLKIDDVMSVLSGLYPEIDNATNNRYTLNGMLRNSVMVFDQSQTDAFTFEVDVETLDIRNKLDGSSISRLAGHIQGHPGKGLIQLDTRYAEIVLPDLFQHPIMLYELDGDIGWDQHGELMVFNIDRIESHTPHFNAALAGTITARPNSEINTNLLFNATGLELENISSYMPLPVPVEVRDWTRIGLISGHISSLDMVLRGDLSAYPFEHQEGQFKVIASLHDATMDYSPKWTPVDRLEAELVIDNNELTLYAHSGYIYNSEITEATAHISELDADQASIVINAHMKGTTDDALFIMNNSPLSTTSLLKEITRHEIMGNLALDLRLDIPFYDKDTSINGDLYFEQVVLKSPDLGIELGNINGNFLFTRDTVTSKSLTAEYSGQPVILAINTDAESRLSLSLSGDADSDFIAGQLAHFFPDLNNDIVRLKERLHGTCSWTASLVPDVTQSDHSSSILTLSSDLSGLALNLPAPLGKNYDAMPLTITSATSSNTQKEIHLTLGDTIRGNIVLGQGVDTTLVRTELALGKETTLLNEGQGLLIQGTVDHLPLSEWHDLIDTLEFNLSDKQDDKILIDLYASSLWYYGQVLTDAHFNLNNQNSGWQIEINSPEAEGNILVTGNTANENVKAEFAHLHLQKGSDTGQESNLDPRTHPALQLTAEDFSYGAINLGRLVLNASAIDNGMSIDTLTFTKPEVDIAGKGTWQIIDDQEFSTFTFKLKATQLENMLATFDYGITPIQDGATKLRLDATWPGSPMDFSLAAVNGIMTMDIGKGKFLDFEPKAGRLFGLLNLQSLLRFVSLDFTVLFRKGYIIDEITGSFSIEEGNAYTNNLVVKGNSADINLTGRTGLIDKDYDQIATVTPRTLFGPLSMGVEAVKYIAGEKIFEPITDKIDKLLRNQYTIKGSWEEPVVEKYQNNGEDSG